MGRREGRDHGGNVTLRLLEQSASLRRRAARRPRTSAAARSAIGASDDHRVEEPCELADEEPAGVAGRAPEPPGWCGTTAAACGVEKAIETVASVPSRTVPARAFVFCATRASPRRADTEGGRARRARVRLRRACARAWRSSPAACRSRAEGRSPAAVRSWIRTRWAVTSPSLPSRSTASSTLVDGDAQDERCRALLARRVHVDRARRSRRSRARSASRASWPWRAGPRRRARGATRCTCSGASTTAAARAAACRRSAALAAPNAAPRSRMRDVRVRAPTPADVRVDALRVRELDPPATTPCSAAAPTPSATTAGAATSTTRRKSIRGSVHAKRGCGSGSERTRSRRLSGAPGRRAQLGQDRVTRHRSSTPRVVSMHG